MQYKMRDLILIATKHTQDGKCNSVELFKILESIKPDVIFDELPIQAFNIYYSDAFDRVCINNILLNRKAPFVSLETLCLKKYRQIYDVEIIPVDIENTRNLLEFQGEVAFLFNIWESHSEYQKIKQEIDLAISQKGFDYLNSNDFLDAQAMKQTIEENIIQNQIEKSRLLAIRSLFYKEQYENRENAMLQNIYNYSKENRYKKAVFLIGAEHKLTLMRNIPEYALKSDIIINWTMYNQSQ